MYSHEDASSAGSVKMPDVFLTPIRPDLIRFVHTNMNKNRRQAHGVAANAGYQTSAESWGTGRAVSRLPRVPGGGTHRAGQAAFGNQCRGGGMFSPLKIWRRWHRKTNVTQKRHAVASALSAAAIPPLVMARGHRIDEVPELPLVVTDAAEKCTKTKNAVELLKKLGADAELEKVKDSKKLRAGKGKNRNRRYVMRKGPLVIYNEDNGIVKAMRNIPGVETACVQRLNLLQLAPGGSLGRFCIFTEAAFKALSVVFGTVKGGSQQKKGYRLMRPMMTNADLARLINSDEIQQVVRPMREAAKRTTQRKNPLRNRNVMARLNPVAENKKRMAELARTEGTKQRKAVLAKKRETAAAHQAHNKKCGGKFYKDMVAAYSAEKSE